MEEDKKLFILHGVCCMLTNHTARSDMAGVLKGKPGIFHFEVQEVWWTYYEKL
jgi:hypothetical protein